MDNWFTSDLHFGHANIIEYCKRPFANVEEMDETLFKNLLETVPAGDTLWVLGDVAMKNKAFAETVAKRLAQMPFKIKIIAGNHDKGKTKIYADNGLLEHDGGRHDYNLSLFRDNHIHNQLVSMGHHPLVGGAPEPKLYLCGHVHEKWQFESFGSVDKDLNATFNINCNVGVDVWDMKPVHLDTIMDARDKFFLNMLSK